MKVLQSDKNSGKIENVFTGALMPGPPGFFLISGNVSIRNDAYRPDKDYTKVKDDAIVEIGGKISDIPDSALIDAPVRLKSISGPVQDALIRICEAVGISYTL